MEVGEGARRFLEGVKKGFDDKEGKENGGSGGWVDWLGKPDIIVVMPEDIF